MVEETVTIYRPVSEVYTYWRNLENLPHFMDHLVEVRAIDRVHSRWVARGPLGVRVEWDAEVINDIPPTLLSWKSMGDSDVVSAGSVRFKPVGEHGTEVRVKLQYDPPAGKLGATVAALLGEDPQHQIAEDLRVFKQHAGNRRRQRWHDAAGNGIRRRRPETPDRSGKPFTSRARECDWTHSGLAHPRGGRPRSGERFDGARMRNVAAHPRACGHNVLPEDDRLSAADVRRGCSPPSSHLPAPLRNSCIRCSESRHTPAKVISRTPFS